MAFERLTLVSICITVLLVATVGATLAITTWAFSPNNSAAPIPSQNEESYRAQHWNAY